MRALFLILFLVIPLSSAISTSGQKTAANDIPTVTYDELIQNEGKYVDRTVRVRAIWTYGFEWTYLCTDRCAKGSSDKAWVEIAKDEEQCTTLHNQLKRLGKKFDNQAEVIVVGKLLASGGYGHMGAYLHAFEISCIEKFKKLQVRCGFCPQILNLQRPKQR